MVSVTRSASFAPAPSTASSGAITSASNSTSVAIAASASTAPEVAQHPLIHGVAQAGEDGRQQDRQQERADHGDERGGDRRDQQQQKGLAEAGLCHGRPEGVPEALDSRDRRSTVTARAHR